MNVGLAREQPLAAVPGQPISDKGQIDPRATNERVDILRVEFEGAVIVKTRLVENGDGLTFTSYRIAKEKVIHRIGRRRALGATGLGAGEFLPEPVGEAGNDLVLHVEEVGDRFVEALGPNVAGGLGIK